MEQSDNPYSVFHATERGEEVYLRVNRPLELLDAAASACIHLEMQQISKQLSYRDYFTASEEISPSEFDAAVTERMENTGIVAGAFRLDFDHGEFSAVHIMDGWKTFQMEDVCKAMKKVGEIDGLDRDEMLRVLTAQLEGRDLSYNPRSDPVCSVLHVTSHGNSSYIRIDSAISFPELAEGLRCYLGMRRRDEPGSFSEYYSGTAIHPNEYDRYVSDYLRHCSDAAGVYDVNLDTGCFSVLRREQGWQRYAVRDVCYAAWQASLKQTKEAHGERFDKEISQRKSMMIPPAVFDHAVGVTEKELKLAVFHVREKQTDARFSLHGPMSALTTASILRRYLQNPPEHSAASFSAYFRNAVSMSRSDYEWYTAEMLGHGNIVTQIYDLDLDGGAFSFLRDDGWKSYPVDLVCEAALQSSDLHRLSPIPEPQRFLDRIAGQEIPRDGLEIYIRGDFRLEQGQIEFSDSVEQMGDQLNFYMPVWFSPDEVFGTYVCTDENDDYVNVYANYDLRSGALCDALDVMLWHADGDCVSMKYRLSAEEKELILPKLAEYCLQDTGMTLEAWCEQFQAEQEAEPQQPMQEWEQRM